MSRSSIPQLALVATIGLFVVAFPRPATAVQYVPSGECDGIFVCTTDCELTGDLACSNAAIELAAGADLDLKGHKLICSNPADPEGICHDSGVVMTAGNSVIKDTGGAANVRGGFEGPFATAIDCTGKNGSRVTGITINGVDGTATRNCRQVDGNVIISRTQLDYVGWAAIVVNTGTAATVTVRQNYVANFGTGINIAGPQSATIEGNVIEMQEPLGGTGFNLVNPVAITLFSNLALGSTVKNNTLLGPGGSIAGNVATITFENNRCDVTSEDCQTCIQGGRCTGPAVPYLLDRSFVLRPISQGSLNQFFFAWPAVSAASHWVTVNDTPDDGIAFHSFISNTQPSAAARTELFYVGDYDAIDSDVEFQSCVIEAHMSASTTVPTYLVVKVHGVQNDGSAISVNSPYPSLYRRTMPTNPTPPGTARWTGADLNDGLLQIGVKNDAGPAGVDVGDVVMRCK